MTGVEMIIFEHADYHGDRVEVDGINENENGQAYVVSVDTHPSSEDGPTYLTYEEARQLHAALGAYLDTIQLPAPPSNIEEVESWLNPSAT